MTSSRSSQDSYAVRFECGPVGASVCTAERAVVVDVLSFTTTLSVAVERGIEVYPFGWNDVRATSYALERGAALAVGRSKAGPGDVSLSPTSVLARSVLVCSGMSRLVLPSPNGSSISFALASSGAQVYGACLRNASAVARHLTSGTGSVSVIAAGERWPDGSLRPAIEDLWGAGAVIAALVDLGSSRLSPEALAAEAAWRAVVGALPEQLPACSSGRELVDAGFARDVEIAGEVDVSSVVPMLSGERFVPA